MAKNDVTPTGGNNDGKQVLHIIGWSVIGGIIVFHTIFSAGKDAGREKARVTEKAHKRDLKRLRRQEKLSRKEEEWKRKKLQELDEYRATYGPLKKGWFRR